MPRSSEELDCLIEAASQAPTPIDITSQPGLWGGRLRNRHATPENQLLSYVGSSNFENATDETHAANLVEADLIQTLSAIGRETIDLYFLRIRTAIEEFQIAGVLEALESARQEGHIAHLGLYCDDGPYAAMSVWQFHDAFDLIQVKHSPEHSAAYDTLAPLARERRVGIVTSEELDCLDSPANSPSALNYLQRACREHPIQVLVRSAEEIRAVLNVDPSSVPADSEPELEAVASSTVRGASTRVEVPTRASSRAGQTAVKPDAIPNRSNK